MSKNTTHQPTTWRNRIIGEGEEAPDQLLANPANWRVHPKAQQDALAGVLDEVGWVQRVIVNQRTGHLVDGHLRVSLALRDDAPTVPVLYVDLDEAEEKLILATIDPVAALAVPDAEKLRDLLNDVQTGNAAVSQMLADVSAQAGVFNVDGIGNPELASGDKGDYEQMTFTLHRDQAASVRGAMEQAKHAGHGRSDVNENSNGNALAAICEAYRG